MLSKALLEKTLAAAAAGDHAAARALLDEESSWRRLEPGERVGSERAEQLRALAETDAAAAVYVRAMGVDARGLSRPLAEADAVEAAGHLRWLAARSIERGWSTGPTAATDAARLAVAAVLDP